jgi:predicted TIM-barrel fold metal-dependent hydrolase
MSRTTDHYTIISADTHAGASHATYREYLDPEYREDFDAWRAQYRTPKAYKDLTDDRRLRNWDNEIRCSQQDADGVVGEVIFPNTIPPFFPGFVLLAPQPDESNYRHRLAGIRAHNRWLVDFCAEYPERRAGIGQVFVNDLDDTIADVHWIKEHGLRGGVLIPALPPDAIWLKPYSDPYYDRFWSVCQDVDIPVTMHSGSGNPSYGSTPSAALMYAAECLTFSNRQLLYFILGGVFERFPSLRFIMTEQRCAWLPGFLQHLDRMLADVRAKGSLGELRFREEHILPRSATEYFRQSVTIGVSQPNIADAAAIDELGPEHFMWGSDYPHDEGTYPYTREHLRQVFPGRPEPVMRQILCENVARVYDFDLDALSRDAARFGPTVGEIAQPLEQLPENPNMALLVAHDSAA